jgi:ATP-binding cassette, subfamily B, bacterial
MFAVAILGVQSAISGAVTSLAQFAQSMMLFSHYGDLVSMGPDLPLAAEPRPVPPLRQGIVLRTCGSATTRSTHGCCAG